MFNSLNLREKQRTMVFGQFCDETHLLKQESNRATGRTFKCDVHTASEETVEAQGTGKVMLKLSHKNVTLKDTQFVRKSRSNLLSSLIFRNQTHRHRHHFIRDAIEELTVRLIGTKWLPRTCHLLNVHYKMNKTTQFGKGEKAESSSIEVKTFLGVQPG